MAYITATIEARETLKHETNITAILPEGADDVKVLYLLHGMGDNHTGWTRYTHIERLADKLGYAVIMPEVQRSFYADMAYGGKYFSYVTEELPKKVEKLFGIKHERGKTFVAGLSMGGYGALKCGLTKPAFYAACASFSGAVEATNHINVDNKERMEWYPEMRAIVGDSGKVGDEGDIYKLFDKAAQLSADERPRVLVTCGSSDFLIEENRRFRDYAEKSPVEFKYAEWDGAHTWEFWEQSLPVMFDFFNKA